MNPLEWAKDRERQPVRSQEYRQRPSRKCPNGRRKETNELDDNELGKILSTLRKQDMEELVGIIEGLTSTDEVGQPYSGFARRGNNKWLGIYRVLERHVVRPLGSSKMEKEDKIRALQWLVRLRTIKKQHESLHMWVLSIAKSGGKANG